MKQLLHATLVYLLYSLAVSESAAQTADTLPCDEIERVDVESDSIKRKILLDYIVRCEQEAWRNDKGIVMLIEYLNENNKQCWLLIPSIDDRYKDNPPRKFATLYGDIILIFDGDKNGNMRPASLDKDKLNVCLEQLVGDRVYIRPKIKTRWADGVRPFTTEKIKEGRRRIIAGNGGTLLIIFNGDGTYRKLLPV